MSQWPMVVADRFLDDGRHIVIADIDGPHHVWLRASHADQPLAYCVPRDELGDIRYLASERLDRRLRGAPPARKGQAHRPTSYQKHRLEMMLAILDLAGTSGPRLATTYAIAREIVYPGLHFASSLEWKSSSQRRQTQRLIDDAFSLINGGYRTLLRGSAKVRH